MRTLQDRNEVADNESRAFWPVRVVLRAARSIAERCRSVYGYARSEVGDGYRRLRSRWFRSNQEGSAVGLLTPEFANGAVLFDGMEHALIGFGTQFTLPVAIYSYEKMVTRLAEDFGAFCEEREACQADHWMEAEEYIEFNTAGGWFGDTTPVILREYSNKGEE